VLARGGNRLGGSGSDSDGLSWISLIKKLSGHESGFCRSNASQIGFQIEHCWVSSGHLGFWVIRVQVGSGFRSSDIG
jgi:hypothetical protein